MGKKIYKEPGAVYCVDATQWGFEQQTGKMYIPTGSTSVAKMDMKDLILTKEGVDYLKLNKQCLISVGGYIHYHDADKSRLLVEQGALTQRRLNTNHVGIIGFGELGDDVELEIHRIDTRMITLPYIPQSDIGIGIVGLEDVDFEDHLVGLVLAGELHWMNDSLGYKNKVAKIIGKNTFKINFHCWDLMKKVFYLKDVFDFSEGMDERIFTKYLDGQISRDEILNINFIEKLLTMSQTFVVIVKTSKPIIMEEISVATHQLSKRYFVPETDFKQYPLRCNDGRYLPYFAQQGGNGLMTIITEDIDYIPNHSDRIPASQRELFIDRPISVSKHSLKGAKFIKMKLKED